MIISRTPMRISFFGGGTDYPVWYREHGGAVLATSINQYCYISCRYLPPFFNYRSRVVWNTVELVNEPGEIQHRTVRESLQFIGITDGVEIHLDSDLPPRSGLGSSSAFTAALLHALYGLKGVMPSKPQLAGDTIHIEHERLQENVGIQDQIAVSYGGFNRVDIKRDGTFQVSPVILPPERLEALQDHLMLFYSGLSRNATEVAEAQIRATQHRQHELHAMQEMAAEALGILSDGRDLGEFGCLLHDAWRLKRSLTNRITTPEIDQIYEAARSAGAIGGKLLGAGGGGFMLLFVPPASQQKVKHELKELLHVPFRFENSGSRIVYYDPANGYNPQIGRDSLSDTPQG